MSKSARTVQLSAARVRADEIAADGTEFIVHADSTASSSLAERLGVERVDDLDARVVLKSAGRGLVVAKGRVAARVVQLCVVTLEPVEAGVESAIDERFRPLAETRAAAEIDIDAEDDAELFDHGEIDLGALVADTLATAIDPYPRAPHAAIPAELEPPQGGAEDSGAAQEQGPASPFAALSALKGRDAGA